MKRLIAFVIFLFYRYYDKGSTKSIAYLSAIIGISFLTFINISTILILFNLDRVFLIIESHGRFIRYISSIVLWLPFYLFYQFYFKKEKIIQMEIPRKKLIISNIALITYIIISITLLVVVINN